MCTSYTFTSKVTVYPGMDGWRFLALPAKEAKDIKARFGKNAKGWGSLPVAVNIGKTEWETSIFPDKKSGTYLLPLKAKVRKAEALADDDTVRFRMRLK